MNYLQSHRRWVSNKNLINNKGQVKFTIGNVKFVQPGAYCEVADLNVIPKYVITDAFNLKYEDDKIIFVNKQDKTCFLVGKLINNKEFICASFEYYLNQYDRRSLDYEQNGFYYQHNNYYIDRRSQEEEREYYVGHRSRRQSSSLGRNELD